MDLPLPLCQPEEAVPSPVHITEDQPSRTITIRVSSDYYNLRGSEKFEAKIDACAAVEKFLIMLDAH